MILSRSAVAAVRARGDEAPLIARAAPPRPAPPGPARPRAGRRGRRALRAWSAGASSSGVGLRWGRAPARAGVVGGGRFVGCRSPVGRAPARAGGGRRGQFVGRGSELWESAGEDRGRATGVLSMWATSDGRNGRKRCRARPVVRFAGQFADLGPAPGAGCVARCGGDWCDNGDHRSGQRGRLEGADARRHAGANTLQRPSILPWAGEPPQPPGPPARGRRFGAPRRGPELAARTGTDEASGLRWCGPAT